MKALSSKKITLMAGALILAAGCAATTVNDGRNEKGELKVDYVCPLDTTVTVVFNRDGDEAKLYDQADRIFTLYNAPAASGAYYKNDEGVSLHTKGDDAIVEFVQGKPIGCKVFKAEK